MQVLELINTLGALWPRLLLAPLGATLPLAAWLIWRLGGRDWPAGHGLRPAAPTVTALAALLWLPMPGTAPLSAAIDLLGAWLLLLWPSLFERDGAPAAARSAALQAVLLSMYGALHGTLTALPFGAGNAAAAVTAAALSGGWCLLIGGQIADEQPGAPYRIVGLAVVGWLLGGGSLAAWPAAVTATAATLIGLRWAGRRVETAAVLMTAAAGIAVIGARFGGFS
jgi:hypothetical protein